MSKDFDAFSEIMRDAMPDAMITNYVIICEVVTEQGTDLQMFLSNGMTPWLASGMIQCAEDMLYNGQHEFHTLEDEGEE